jgi:hypothetical protein
LWVTRKRFLDSISIFPLLFGAEHYQSLEIAATNVGQHYLKLDLLHIEFCRDAGF